MTIFKSRQVNTDSAPWVDEYGERHSLMVGMNVPASQGLTFNPRPEFNVTRDRKPWVNAVGVRVRHEWNAPDHQPFHWKPRPEFDHPVNRVLVHFRSQLSPLVPVSLHARGFLNGITRLVSEDFTVAEIDHARRVLTRLANMKEPSNG